MNRSVAMAVAMSAACTLFSICASPRRAQAEVEVLDPQIPAAMSTSESRSNSAEITDCAVPAGASATLAQKDAHARLRYIRESLRETARVEKRYTLIWSLTYVGLAGGTWALYPFADDKEGKRRESGFNTGTSLLGAITSTIQPLITMRDTRRLEALLAQPEKAGSLCAVLAQAERLFAHAADNERSARSASSQFLTLGSNLALGFIMAYALNRKEAAAEDTTIGMILSEIQILTRPTRAMRSLEHYQQGDLTPVHDTLGISLAPIMPSTSNGYGFGVAGTF